MALGRKGIVNLNGKGVVAVPKELQRLIVSKCRIATPPRAPVLGDRKKDPRADGRHLTPPPARVAGSAAVVSQLGLSSVLEPAPAHTSSREQKIALWSQCLGPRGPRVVWCAEPVCTW